MTKISETARRSGSTVAYRTEFGSMIHGTIEDAIESEHLTQHTGQVQLIFTSPPFPLNNKKKYGNRQGEEYLEWLASLAPRLVDLLAPTGSIVIELGNAWERGRPVMSTLALRSLLAFQEAGNLSVCQMFVAHNPARLPSPAQWVTVERIRVKDSYTNIWWMSPTDRPKANNRRVLVPYSDPMKRLLKSGKYNAGSRPSEHVIGESSFLVDNGGAIPPNVLQVANTNSSDRYQIYCREQGLQLHPARMPLAIPEFFINFLTDPGDIVVDPFGGSNTTGFAAEKLGRRWIAVEPDLEYVRGSLGRFENARVLM